MDEVGCCVIFVKAGEIKKTDRGDLLGLDASRARVNLGEADRSDVQVHDRELRKISWLVRGHGEEGMHARDWLFFQIM